MTVTLSFYYRDSAPGGGPCADEADAKREAAKVAREVLESFNPSAEGTDELIRSFLMEAADDTDDDARLYEDARLGVGDLDDDEALDLAAEDCGFTWECLPGAPAALDVDALRQALETALTGVAGLLANWERGDLAGQVHALQGWADATFEKFPDLDAERWIEVADLRPGDRVDMQGVYAEDSVDGHAAEFEYCRVIGVEREAPDCLRVDFEGSDSFGFDPFRFVRAVCTAKDRAEWADPEATVIAMPPPGELINPDPARLRAGDVFYIDDTAEGRTYPTLCDDGGPPAPGYYVARADATSTGAEGPLTRPEAYDLAATLDEPES